VKFEFEIQIQTFKSCKVELDIKEGKLILVAKYPKLS